MRKKLLVLFAAAALTRVAAAQSLPGSLSNVDASAIGTLPAVPYGPNDVKVVVSIPERRMWVIAGEDTVRAGTVSVASGADFMYAGRRWRFDTPRGVLKVRGKKAEPVWLPPDWHYAEVASMFSLGLKTLPQGGVRLTDGTRIVVRDSLVGLVKPGDSTFLQLPVDEHIVFDSTLFIPPVNTHNRHLTGALGRYALDLGNGYLLHGTPDQASIGIDTTHGCIRLADEDLLWMFENIPVGASVIVR